MGGAINKQRCMPGQPHHGLEPRVRACRMEDRLVEQEVIYEKLPTDIAERCAASAAALCCTRLAPWQGP